MKDNASIIETIDPTTWIVEEGLDENNIPYKIYENIDGRKYSAKGFCIACGMCDPIANVGETIEITNYVKINNEIQTYTRRLKWVKEPGEEGACIEENYELRKKDIPITPDFEFEKNTCTMTFEWIK